jgi:hypothetical protein
VARLDGEVAALYGVGVADYQRIVDGFPLIPRRVREMAVDALRRIRNE